jgi:hypothetical protein
VARTPALVIVLALASLTAGVRQALSQEAATGWRARCRTLRTEIDSLPLAATRCAALFVRVNGYTGAPGTSDTTEIVLEPRSVMLRPGGQPPPPIDWAAVVAGRRGQLRPEPVAASCLTADCLVIFEYADSAHACHFRALVLSLDLRAVGFAHQDILPRSDQLPSRCRDLREGGPPNRRLKLTGASAGR